MDGNDSSLQSNRSRSRRAGESRHRQGVRNPKDADGNSTGSVAINPWGALYVERKAYELAREVDGKPMTAMHAHNRAKRYVEKRLLRELWKAWRVAS